LSNASPGGPIARARSVDALTVIGIAILAYCISNVVHEGLGHGYACVLAGGKPQVLNAIFFSCDEAGLTMAGKRLLAAGGSIANLVLAGFVLIALKLWKGSPGATHYFLWLLFAVNILMPFGYLLFSGIGGIGDWVVVIDGFRPVILYRALLTIVGAFLYFVVASRLLMPGLNLYLGREASLRQERTKLLALLPYLTGGITFVVAGLLNPEGIVLVLISAAAASFGGTSWLAWYPRSKKDERSRELAPAEPASIPRQVPWVVAGAIAFVLFVGVLGPGIKLGKT
jgi:hypothetical protein